LLPINIPACHPVPGDESIDPILCDMVNHTSPADYHLPGAVVDHDLAMPVTEYQGRGNHLQERRGASLRAMERTRMLSPRQLPRNMQHRQQRKWRR